MPEVTMDKVVSAYLATRQELDRIKEELSQRSAPLLELQEKRENWMMGVLAANGAQNMATPHGTAYITTTESVTVGEWDTVFAWIEDTGNKEFLVKGVNKTAVLEFMGEKREYPPPPGVNYTAIRKLAVRKK